MARNYVKLLVFTAYAVLFIGLALPGQALSLLAPTEGQIVRENVKIVLPSSGLPSDGFISIFAGETGAESFVAALGRKTAVDKDGKAIFVWNSKSPYHEPSDPTNEKFFKDGKYSLKVQIHDVSGNLVDSSTISIELRNKVARTNPAPAVTLTNKLAFGQLNTYRVNANVQFYNVVGLPILGGAGMTSDFRVIQSVEDIRSAGEFLIRYRIGEGAYISSASSKQVLFQGEELKPQLYRLVNKYGNVIKANLFTKQGKYTLMDILPVLPSQSVKEGDAWPSSLTLKIEGLMNPVRLDGTSMLDSFEWQNGIECVKIMSNLTGNSYISLLNGKIRSSSDSVNAKVITYFAYKSGKMLRSEIVLNVPAVIDAGAELLSIQETVAADSGSPSPLVMNPSVYDSEEDESPVYNTQRPTKNQQATPKSDTGSKGSVQIRTVVQLEK